MIYITRLNHAPSLLNADLIEHIEATPDTVITLTNGQKYMVLEEPEEVVDRVIAYRRRCRDVPTLGTRAEERHDRTN